MIVRVEEVAGRMRRMFGALALIVAAALLPSVVLGEETQKPEEQNAVAAVQPGTVTEAPVTQPMPTPATAPKVRPIELQYFRPHDTRGLNVFEAPKTDPVAFEGQKLVWGFAFAQQFQGLNHNTSAAAKMVPGANNTTLNANQLMEIGYGFNNANANLYLDAQLAKGIRVALTGYLSSRHHQETWVKDGYLLVDGSPIDHKLLNQIMDVVTLRIGHFEINYGDAHFRRSDNGMAFFNPFVGNLLMDAFTTEIGAEAYVRKSGFLAMAGVTGGEIRGQVQRPNDRSLSYLAKVGVDRQLNATTRVRLTGSLYTNNKSVSNTLYSGSRTGSRYYSVLENAQSTESAQAWSGDIQPGFKNRVTAWVVNPFVKYRGVELFGNIEQARGRASTESRDRTFTQYAGDVVYRFLGDQLYVGSRYNVARGTLAAIGDVEAQRIQAGGGWFVTPNILAKAEYVRQDYRDFPINDIRKDAKFDGFMIEGVVTF